MADELSAWLYGEPTITELLSDPIAELLMRCDRITVEDVLAAVQNAQARLNSFRPQIEKPHEFPVGAAPRRPSATAA